MRFQSCLSVIVIGLLATAAQGAVPASLSVQGKLTDLSGNPIAGSQNFTFKIYDDPVAGSEVWPGGPGENQSLNTDANGLWIGLVGAVIPLTNAVFQDTVRWLEITVNGTTLPRTRLATGAYAHRVGTVDGASGGWITSKVTIGVGHTNTAPSGFVAGHDNTVAGEASTIGGGYWNTASNHASTVAGGYSNFASGYGAAIGGGDSDTASGGSSVVAGGSGNVASEDYSFIGGGYLNRVSGAFATIAGGSRNEATGSYATIGGGYYDSATANYATVSGGAHNDATAVGATVGGGRYNYARGQNSVVAGGGGLESDSNSALGVGAAIGGGSKNVAAGDIATISGGLNNRASAINATVGGGGNNQAHAAFATIAGGEDNYANNTAASIGGGLDNYIIGSYATITGGWADTATQYAATVCGGAVNTASGINATVVGGQQNVAAGSFSFAAGQRAKALHNGSWVWADLSNTDFASTSEKQFLIRAGGGVGINTNTPSQDLTINGTVAFENSAVPAIYMFESGTANADKMILAHSTGFADYGLRYQDFGDKFQFIGDGLPAMTIDLDAGGGFVGFGSVTSPSNIVTLPNLNNTAGRALGFAWDVYSSRRWKTNIRPLEGSLEKVRRLQGVSYDPIEGGGRQIGLIAEDVGQVVPEVVQYEDNGIDAKSIDYARLVALLIEGMKEQQKRIETLEATIRQMQP